MNVMLKVFILSLILNSPNLLIYLVVVVLVLGWCCVAALMCVCSQISTGSFSPTDPCDSYVVAHIYACVISGDSSLHGRYAHVVYTLSGIFFVVVHVQYVHSARLYVCV